MKFQKPPRNPQIVELERQIHAAILAPADPIRAERLQRELADLVRNQHRIRKGLAPIVERWDTEPEEIWEWEAAA